MKSNLYKPPKSLIVRMFDITFIGLCLISLGLPLGSVLAQPPAQATTPPPTVTITAPPPYRPDVNYTMPAPDTSCPGAGTPVANWGQVTPDSMWNLLCSQCVVTPLATSTPQPIATYNGTGTPPAGCTPVPIGTGTPSAGCSFAPTVTAVPTVTQIPTSNISCGSSTSGIVCEQVNNALIKYTVASNVSGNGSLVYGYGLDSGSVVYAKFERGGVESWVYWHTGVGYHVGFQAVHYDAYTNGLVHNFQTHNLINWGNSGGDVLSLAVSEFSFMQSVIVGTSLRVQSNDSVNYSKLFQHKPDGVLYLSTNGTFENVVTPSPSPTPNPSALGYCQSVSSNEQGFSWDGIEYGTTSCFDLGPYDLMGYWGPSADGDPRFGEIPWIAHVCLQEISFGEATIFGVTVSLQIIMYSLGVALIIRNMFIS